MSVSIYDIVRIAKRISERVSESRLSFCIQKGLSQWGHILYVRLRNTRTGGGLAAKAAQ